jgi:hypothetical protein
MSIYWEIEINERDYNFFYNGYIYKDDYEKIKLINPNINICFGEISKHCYSQCFLNEITFFEDINKEIENNYKYSRNNFDLINFLIENEYYN